MLICISTDDFDHSTLLGEVWRYQGTYCSWRVCRYRWYHAKKSNTPEQDFSKKRFKVFRILCSGIITSLWSYLKLQNATQHEMHAVSIGTIHFPKFSFIPILRFIRPFGICVYTLLSSTHFSPFSLAMCPAKFHFNFLTILNIFSPGYTFSFYWVYDCTTSALLLLSSSFFASTSVFHIVFLWGTMFELHM